MIITIDGPAGSGKSSVAQALSQRLGFPLLLTGVLYRTCACGVYRKGIDPTQEHAVASFLRHAVLSPYPSSGSWNYMLNGEDFSADLFHETTTHIASLIASYRTVREILLPVQRSFASLYPDIICEGRDMGSTVFPHADRKIFLTASLEERARRRATQLKSPCSLAEITAALEARDTRDASRSYAPLTIPPAAWVLDSTSLNTREVVEHLAVLALPQHPVPIQVENTPEQTVVQIQGSSCIDVYEQIALWIGQGPLEYASLIKTWTPLTCLSHTPDSLFTSWVRSCLKARSLSGATFLGVHIHAFSATHIHAGWWSTPTQAPCSPPEALVQASCSQQGTMWHGVVSLTNSSEQRR